MKTVCMLTYERTGSTWLCNSLDPKPGTHEIFCQDPLLSINIILDILQNFYKIDDALLKTISTIYNSDNFFINAAQYRILTERIVNNKPYSMDFFYIVKSIYKKLNKNLLFKIFPAQLSKFDISLNAILDMSDYLIYNYRNDILQSFISFKKAIFTGQWTSTHELIRKNTSNKIHKIVWDEQEYIKYYNYIIDTHNNFYTAFCIFNKPKIMISYEEIHEQFISDIDKNKYIQKLLNKSNILLNSYSCCLKKQNTHNIYTDAISIISNYKNFYDSLHRIKTKIYE